MRRWLRVLTVGVLTVVLAIDSASACRLFRSRCRPRCRVVSCRVVQPAPECGSVATYRPCESIVIVESLPRQCCVPADGSAHAVIVESGQPVSGPPVEISAAPAAADETSNEKPSVVADAPRPATPAPVSEPPAPLVPIAPASAEKPMSPAPAAGTEPASVPEPQFKTAAQILAESAERERLELEKAAAEAPKPTVPEPQFKTAAEILAETAEKEAADKAALDAAKEQPAEPPMEKAPPRQPTPKAMEKNLFDEDGDAAAEKPAGENQAPMKKKQPRKEPVEDLFDEPEAENPPADAKPDSTEKPAEEALGEEEPTEKMEKPEDDPFASRETAPEPVRRWIDASGRHETIGRLVEVHADRVRILKANGRYTTVPMHQLSHHDQAYAATAGERLAGRDPTRPAATDTALR